MKILHALIKAGGLWTSIQHNRQPDHLSASIEESSAME